MFRNMLKYVKMLCNISNYIGIHSNNSKCFKIYQNISKYIYENKSNSREIFRNIFKHFGIYWNVSEYIYKYSEYIELFLKILEYFGLYRNVFCIQGVEQIPSRDVGYVLRILGQNPTEDDIVEMVMKVRFVLHRKVINSIISHISYAKTFASKEIIITYW